MVGGGDATVDAGSGRALGRSSIMLMLMLQTSNSETWPRSVGLRHRPAMLWRRRRRLCGGQELPGIGTILLQFEPTSSSRVSSASRG